MLLLEKCEKLSSLLDKHKELEKNRQAAEALEERRKELVHIHDGCLARVEMANVFLTGEVIEKQKLPVLSHVTDKAKSVLGAFLEDSSKITKGRLYSDLKTRAETLNAKYDEALKSAWKDFFKKHAIEIDQNLLKKFKETGQFEDAIEQVLTLNNSVKVYKIKHPDDKKGLKEFLVLSNQLREKYADIQSANLPDDVAAFLRAASSPKGARLTLLTSTIIQWLKDNKMYDTFRIRA